MKIVKSFLVLGIAMIALWSNNTLADACSGFVISEPLEPILIRKAADGSKVMWISSEGVFIVSTPANHPANLVGRVCGGGFKIAPDGKSGLGQGSCTYADQEGDAFYLDWQSTFIEGTWKLAGGTGKFESFSGEGTFRPSKKFENMWSSSTWEGECSLEK